MSASKSFGSDFGKVSQWSLIFVVIDIAVVTIKNNSLTVAQCGCRGLRADYGRDIKLARNDSGVAQVPSKISNNAGSTANPQKVLRSRHYRYDDIAFFDSPYILFHVAVNKHHNYSRNPHNLTGRCRETA